MQNVLIDKTKQFFFVLIKLSLVVSAFYFIYHKLIHNKALSISSFINLLNKNQVLSPKNILILVILTGLNWFFDILKWQALVFYVKNITFKNALKQVFGALTASIFTPNRIGEYGAKAMYYKPNLRKRIMLVNLVGNILQMAVTTILGVIGFCFYVTKYQPSINYLKFGKILLISVFILSITCFLIKKTNYTIGSLRLKKALDFLITFPKNILIKSALLALTRYAIFSFQFYVLLSIFKINFTYLEAMVIITTMYLLVSIIPSVFIFDVLVKGSIATYLFSLTGVNTLVILSIITTMWIFNFVIPSIIGSYYVIRFKYPKNENYS